MSVSDERIERAARAMWEVNPPNPPGWAPWGDRDGWGPSIPERRFTLAQARAALEADAPALEAARAEGMRGRWRTICDLETVLRRIRDFVEDEHERRDVVGIDEASDYATEPEKIMAIIDAELGSIAIDARISEMKEANS